VFIAVKPSLLFYKLAELLTCAKFIEAQTSIQIASLAEW
jgi:hypothetical protein